MADVVLFHHVQGRTDGVLALADRLRAGGHGVTAPDLFDGAVAASIDEGFALASRIGQDAIAARAAAAVAAVDAPLVVAGVSFGVMSAQTIAQTGSRVVGALLYEACLPVSGEWAVGPWPPAVAVQVHGADGDPFFAGEGDLDAARELVASVPPGVAELFTYPGDAHLFTDSSLPSYDAAATELVVQRSLALLARLEERRA